MEIFQDITGKSESEARYEMDNLPCMVITDISREEVMSLVADRFTLAGARVAINSL